MDKTVIETLRLAMDKWKDLDFRWQEEFNKLKEMEALQSQTVIALSDEQYSSLAKTVNEQRKVFDEFNLEIHETERLVLALVEELLESIV